MNDCSRGPGRSATLRRAARQLSSWTPLLVSPKCVIASRRRPRAIRLDRPVPCLDVDVRRRRGCELHIDDGGIRTPPMSPTNARVLVQVGDVVGGVPRRVDDPESAHPAPARRPQHAEVGLGHREHLAPQRSMSSPYSSRRSSSASKGRSGAARRARARRPPGPATAAPTRPWRRRGRDGCGSATALEEPGPRAPRATSAGMTPARGPPGRRPAESTRSPWGDRSASGRSASSVHRVRYLWSRS